MKTFKFQYQVLQQNFDMTTVNVSGTVSAENQEVGRAIVIGNMSPNDFTNCIQSSLQLTEVNERESIKKEDPCLWAFLFGALVGMVIGVIVTYCFYYFAPQQ